VACGPRTIGVLLSGALDDGSAGLVAIKRCGGIAIVQAPEDARVPDMLASAIRNASVDHILPAREIAPMIERLVKRPSTSSATIPDDLITDVQIAEAGRSSAELQEKLGQLTCFTCADCGGPLWKQAGPPLRFRCLTGHALTARSLEAGLDQNLEAALWAAIRQFEQRANLQRGMAAEEQTGGRGRGASRYLERAEEACAHAEQLRRLLLSARGTQES
jgi:two-component system, chemotaxis family, protein-glutamate methylesterase/glutaminase